MTTDTITTESLMSALDAAQAHLAALYARVNTGLAWLKTHSPRDPQYARAEVLLATLQDELQTAQTAQDAAQRVLNVALQTRPDTGKSLTCQICNKPVHGETTPGYYTHLSCIEEKS